MLFGVVASEMVASGECWVLKYEKRVRFQIFKTVKGMKIAMRVLSMNFFND
jgi:hypothetical protein